MDGGGGAELRRDRWTVKQTYGWTDEGIDGQIKGQIEDEWRERWIDWWMNSD